MAERFKMEGVLRHRKHLEEEAQAAFAASLRQWTQARRALEELIRKRKQYRRELKHKIQGQATADELILYHRYLDRLGKEIESQIGIVEDMAIAKEEKRSQLVAALRDRKVLEKLKAQHQEAAARRRRAKEQDLINEAAVNRYQRKQRLSGSSEKG